MATVTAAEKLEQYKKAMAQAKTGNAPTGSRPPTIRGATAANQVPLSWAKLGWKKPPGIAEIPDVKVAQLLNYARLGYDMAMSLAAKEPMKVKASAWQGVAEMYAAAIDFVNSLPGGWGPPETQAQLGASVRAFITPANMTASAVGAGGASKLTAKKISRATGVPSTPTPPSARPSRPAISRTRPTVARPTTVALPAAEKSSDGGGNTALWIVGGVAALGIVAALAFGGKKKRAA